MPTNRIEGRTAVFADWAWQALLVSGTCSVLAGVVLAVWPNKSEMLAGILAGLVLLASAGAQFIVAFGARISTPLKVLEFFAGVAAALLGIWCFDSGQWVLLLALWIGMGWMIRGVAQAIVAAWSNDLEGAGWHEIVGLVTTVVGLVIAIGPFDTMTAFSVAVGVFTVALGATEIMTAARVEGSVGATV